MTFEIPSQMTCYRFRPSATSPLQERVSVPEPKDDEVLVKILAAGLCHSDVGLFESTSLIHRAIGKTVYTGGHEGAGIVVRLGASVPSTHPSLAIGTYAALYCVNPCWKPSCLACSTGNENICGGKPCLGQGLDGTWADYMVINAADVVPVPGSIEQVPPAVAAIATDAILTPYHALKDCCAVQPGQTVLCFGVGGLGLHAVAIASEVLGATVIACDVRETSLQHALAMGAQHTVLPANLVAYINDHKLVVDVAVDFVGLQSTFNTCFTVIKPGGTIHITGLMADNLKAMPIKTMMKNLRLTTSFWGLKHELAEILQALADGKLKTLVEARPMSQCGHLLHDMHKGKLKGRVAVIPDAIYKKDLSHL